MNIQNTQFIGKVLLYFPTLSSTNDFALQLLDDEKVKAGTIVATAHQFSGKGQMGNIWETPPHQNITMSIILRPTFLHARQQFFLNVITALAIRATVARFVNEHIQIKWANDVLINTKKTCGILIQNTLLGEQIQTSVVGIGVNVNQTHFGEHLPHATSMACATGKQFSVETVLNEVCQQFERYYFLLNAGDFELLQTLYYQHLYNYQRLAWYEDNSGNRFQGVITGIDESGKLKIKQGIDTKVYDLKTIKQLLE